MGQLDHLLENNRAWADEVHAHDPAFFERLAAQQRPSYLWIGCSDSRVPANTIVGLPPGEVFVHRNVANMVKHSDMNCMSAMQFAVDVLGVKHIIVCGHYGCSGIHAALGGEQLGLVDNWLTQMHAIQAKHAALLDNCSNSSELHNLMCELNVIEQVTHTCQSTVVRGAWRRGQALSVHGWIYGLKDGRIRDLDVSRHGQQSAQPSPDPLLVARERDIAAHVAIRTSAPDCRWGQDDGA